MQDMRAKRITCFWKETDSWPISNLRTMRFAKTRKYGRDIGRMENMEYDEEADCYYCKNGQALTVQYEKEEKDSQRLPADRYGISEQQLWRMSFQDRMYQGEQL